MTETIEPIKVGECFKLILHSQNGTMRTDNSFNFNVNLKEIEGDVVRCAVRKVRYPAPASYISRRLWFADGNTWKNSATGANVNDYDALLAKYGLYNPIYLYHPRKAMYFRIIFNSAENSQVRNTGFSSSLDGINWSAYTSASGIGLENGIDFWGAPSVYIDCYEIDITTTPIGTNLQNIHCPGLRASMSFDTTTKSTTDIIGNIVKSNANSYVVNDCTYQVKDHEVCHEISGSGLRAMSSLNIYFSRVATPYVKEPIVMPWSVELFFFKVA